MVTSESNKILVMLSLLILKKLSEGEKKVIKNC